MADRDTGLLGGETLPWSWYADEAVLARERERIFRHSWQYVGHTGEVERPGDYFAGWAGHVPVVVTRADDGELRAFVNVCRHRGAQVVEGAGNRRTLQCRYHAWTYGLDGSLRTAPRSEREPGFDPAALSLLPVRVAAWGPLVFVNPDLEAPALEQLIGDLPAQLAEGGVDLGRLVFRDRIPWELAANWKVVIENYLECYHCAVAHPGFSGLVDVDPETYTLTASEWSSSQYAGLRSAGKAAGSYDGRGAVERGQFHFLWPNLRINVFPGPLNLAVGPALPVDPGRTRGFFDYFFAPDAEEEVVRDLLAFDDQVGREDRELVESVQRGVGSGMLPHGRLLMNSEHLIHHFQALVRRALGD